MPPLHCHADHIPILGLMTILVEPVEDHVDTFFRYLATHAIRIRDAEELRSKLVTMKSDGIEKVQVVSDFDRTLTPQWLKDPCSDGKPVACHSSHGVVETSPFVTQAYAKHTRDLANHYMPLEHDITLGVAKQTELMVEWYHKAHECMLQEGLTESKMDSLVETSWKRMEIHLRQECTALFENLKSANIPVTVLSAGLADVIQRILAMEGIDFPLLVGNRMQFDDEGKHTGFSEPLIHSLNKGGALAHALAECPVRAVRPNAILMGDLIGDVDFVHAIPRLDEYIAIGFLADGPKQDERMHEYLKYFDIVITGGAASVDVAIELIKCVAHASQA